MVDPRPKIPVYFLRLAELVATRATCARRAVGCVLTDAGNRVLATGYNGVPAGEPHCVGETPCPGAGEPSGTGLDRCEAIHAEQNALLQLRRGSDEVRACFSTTFPCAHCLKLLLH